jgi:hypothetical protein
MLSCSIQFVQGATTYPVGQAAIGVDGESVTVSNGDGGTFANYTFTVIDSPPGSAIPIGVAQAGATPTWSFTPDVVDCFLILLTCIDSLGNVYTDYRAFGVNRASGRIIPPFFGDAGSLNFSGVTAGWAPIMRAWLAYLDTVSGSIGGGAASSTQSGAIALPAGSSVIAVDLTSVDATVNLDQVSYVAGLAYQFDTRGSHNILFTSARGILAPQNGGVSQTSVTVNPVSESVIAKANAWGSWSLI